MFFSPNFNWKNGIVSQGLLDLKQRTFIPVKKTKIGICKCISQDWSNSLETRGGGGGGWIFGS